MNNHQLVLLTTKHTKSTAISKLIIENLSHFLVIEKNY